MASLINYHPSILQALTYEVVNGQPILLRGHQAVARGQKTVKELHELPNLQQQFLSRLCFDLHADFGREYFILSNPQLRLSIDKHHWRAIDVAIVKKNTRKFLGSPILQHAPEYVFLIGNRAALFDLRHPFSYYHQKANDLLAFGVQKVVWLFPEKQQLMLAGNSRHKWPMQIWDRPVELEPGLWWDCPVYSKQ